MVNSRSKAKEEEQFDAGSSGNDVINKVWNFLSSMKLGIILLLIMAIVSIIGTIWIPRDPVTGQEDFTKFYNSIPFRLIMGLLALNLLVCSINRWKSIVGTLRGPNPNFSENLIKNSKNATSLKLKIGINEAADNIKNLLKSKGYRVFVKEDGDIIKVASDKGHIGILGPYITHISFIVMIVAIVIKFSGLVGFEGRLAGLVGQTYNLTNLEGVQGTIKPEDNFDLKVNNFRTEYRPDGSIKQWYSDVTVIDKDKTFDYSIYVNNPLVYKGIKFYQSSYGYQYSGKYSGPSGQNQPFTIGMQDYIQPAGTDITFVPDQYNDAKKTIVVYTYKGNQEIKGEEVPLNTPYKFENAEVTFENVSSYTVLSVKKDPGVPYVGVGSILLILGVTFSFVFRQRRIWTMITPQKEGSLVQITGISAKDKRGLDTDIENIVDDLSN